MDEQTKRLVAEGHYALFVPLESLDKEPLTTVLEPSHKEKLEAWKADGSEPGWFFLDAVDELNLTNGKLDRALRRLAGEIESRLGRARIVVSCRPSDSDWRPSLDLATMQNRLPVPERSREIVAPAQEEVFMAALRPAPAEPVRFSDRDQSGQAGNAVQTVGMLPMDEAQVLAFAKHLGVW